MAGDLTPKRGQKGGWHSGRFAHTFAAIRTGKLPSLRQSLGDDPEALTLYDKLYEANVPAERD